MLAWPPIPYTSPLLLAAFVPLLYALEQIIQSTYAKKGKKVFLVAGLTCLLWNTCSIYWVFNAISSVMPVYAAALVTLIPYSLGALLMTMAFWLYYQLRRRYSFAISFAGLISFWISYEYLHQSWDLSFPWMTLGNGFAASTPLVQWYEYTGVYGGSLWIWLSNGLLFSLFIAKQTNQKKLKLTLASLSIIIVPIGLSLIRYFTYQEKEDPANVVVVQPNIDPYGKYDDPTGLHPYITPERQLEILIGLSKKAAQKNTEFFIWPETAISEQVDEALIRNTPAYKQILQFLAPYKNSNLLSGIESYRLYSKAETTTAREARPGMFYDSFNAAVLIDNSSKVQFYHKSKLVPAVERMPFMKALAFMKPLFAAFGGTTGGYGSQKEPNVFYSQSGIGTAPVICYESIWGAYVGLYIKKGAQFIAVITNDGWWGNTSGKDQHLDYAKLRAIETRRWIVRAANTGISAFINQRGDVVQKTNWWQPIAIKADINLNEELTFYVRTGDYIAYFGCFGTLFSMLLILFRRKLVPSINVK